MQPVTNIEESKVMACVASLHPGRNGTCLDFDTTIDIIRISRTGALVYHVPAEEVSPKTFSEYHWSFPDLLRRLGDTSHYAILANTSGATDAHSAVKIARAGVSIFNTIKSLCPHQTQPVIKLEVLENDLHTNDIEVIRATKELTETYNLTVIPFVSACIDSIMKCADIGVPMVRVLSGSIGTMGGIQDEEKLRRVISQSPIPVIVEGGIGTVEHVMQAFQAGATAVLLNSAFRIVADPIRLALDLRQHIDSFFSCSTSSNKEY